MESLCSFTANLRLVTLKYDRKSAQATQKNTPVVTDRNEKAEMQML